MQMWFTVVEQSNLTVERGLTECDRYAAPAILLTVPVQKH